MNLVFQPGSQADHPSLNGSGPKGFTRRSHSRSLLPTFWVVVGGLAVYALPNAWNSPILLVFMGGAVGFCALLPGYLWCAGKAPGLPIFPLLALTYVWTFAFPLMAQKSLIAAYDVPVQLEAAITAILFLAAATWIWWKVMRARKPTPSVIIALPSDTTNRIFLIGLAGCCLGQMAMTAGWLNIPGGAGHLLVAAMAACSILSIMILGHNLGRRFLSPKEQGLFLFLLVAWLVITTTGILLINSLAAASVAIIAFTLGRGKLPIPHVVLTLIVFGFLHIGKMPMRAQRQMEGGGLQPIDYPGFYIRWFEHSLDALPEVFQSDTERKTATITERSSLIQMTMLVQSKTPSEVPYLGGETYAAIPRLLLPRMIDPDKPWSHEGAILMCIAYGLQTREMSKQTSIAFGLLAEAYANFGYVGVVGLALLVGWVCGVATRMGRHVPLTSLRGLASLLALSAALQVEYTAGVLVTTLFQEMVVLAVMSLLLMRRQVLRLPMPHRAPSQAGAT